MRNVYSTQLGLGILAPGASQVFIVPAGFVCVVRDLSATSVAVLTAGQLGLLVNGGVLVWQGNCPVATAVSVHFDAHIVVPAGGTVTVSAAGTTWPFVLSGYLLTLP